MARKWYAYIFRENAYGLAAQACVFLGGLISTLIFPNLLGKEGFGYYSLAIGVVTGAVFLSDLGIPNAVLRFIPAGAKQGIAWRYFRLLLKLKLAASLLVAIAVFLGADAIAGAYASPALADGLRVGSIFLFGYSMIGFADNVFVAMKKAKNSLILNILFHGGRIVVPLAVFFAYRQDYVGIMLGLGAAAVLSVVPMLAAAWREPALRKGKPGRMDIPAIKSYMLFGTIFIIAYGVTQWSDTLLLGLFKPVAEVSVYRVAWLWAYATVFLLPFSQRIFLSAHAYEGVEKSRKLLRITMRYGFVFAFLMIAGIFLVSGQFLGIIYGNEFDSAYPILVILSVLTIELMLNSITGGLFIGKGDMRTPGWAGVAAAAGQVALVLLLAPAYGMLGAAVGVVVPRVLVAVAQAIVALRFVSMKIPPSYVYRPAICAAGAIALLMPFYQHTFSLIPALAYGTAAAFTYGLLSLGVGAVDLQEIRRIAKGSLS